MWYVLISLVIAIYFIINLVLPGMIDGVQEAYIVRPALWIFVAISVFLIARHEGLNIFSFKRIRRWEFAKSPFYAALIIGGFQISLLIIAGLLLGFGKSPNIITTSSFFIFLIYILSSIFAIELTRSYLIKKGVSSTRRNITLVIAIVTLFCMLLQFRIVDIMTLESELAVLEFIGGTVIIALAMGLFASYLAYYGGALPAIVYMGMLSGFEMFSPILPDIDWILKALIGLMVPAIGFLLIQQSIQESGKHGTLSKKLRKRKDPTLIWVGTGLVCLLLIFFSFGYFGVQPTIISSGSMRPSLDTGDVVIVTDVEIDEIKEGDLIQYEWNEFSTIHRVHKVHNLGEGTTPIMFTTKGDANDEPDVDPVMPDQVTGKVVFNIPKIGWIPLVLKSIFNKIGLMR